MRRHTIWKIAAYPIETPHRHQWRGATLVSASTYPASNVLILFDFIVTFDVVLFFVMSCRLSRKNNQSISNWGEKHKDRVREWDERTYRKDDEKLVPDADAYEAHMRWYDDNAKFRVRLRPQWTTADIASLEEDDTDEEPYRDSLRDLKGGLRVYAPLVNRVISSPVLHCFELLSGWIKSCFVSVTDRGICLHLQSSELNRCIFYACL
jgi:hypothetical protein